MPSIFTDPQTLGQLSPYGGTMNVAGGGQQAEFNLAALDLAQQMETTRQTTGFQLLDYLTQLQKDPFSIVPALQAYTAAGGGSLAPAVAFQGSGGAGASGGAGMPSPYGEIADRLIAGLAEFSGAAPVNPYTGLPYTPAESQQVRQTEFRLSQMAPEQRAQAEADIRRLHSAYVGGQATPGYLAALAPGGPFSAGVSNPTLARAQTQMNRAAGRRTQKSGTTNSR